MSTGQKTTNNRFTRISRNSDQQGMFKGNIASTGLVEKFGRKKSARSAALMRLAVSQFWMLRPCMLAHVTAIPSNNPKKYSG